MEQDESGDARLFSVNRLLETAAEDLHLLWHDLHEIIIANDGDGPPESTGSSADTGPLTN